jgi:hypothetical protein
LYCRPSLIRDWLTYYKVGREIYRPEFTAYLARILKVFLSTQGSSLRAYLRDWTDVAIVPSTYRLGPHPMARIAQGAGLAIAQQAIESAGLEAQHRVYDPQLFTIYAPRVQGRRFLLLEDVYVSGARAQSAATALRSAGAEVAGILALGRRVNPEWDVSVGRFWVDHLLNNQPLREGFRWLAEEGTNHGGE